MTAIAATVSTTPATSIAREPRISAQSRRMSGNPVRAWSVLIVAAIARGILLSAVSLIIWAAVPALWGWMPTTVKSDSMAPAIRAGDVVVSAPANASNIHLGQVLLVDDPDHHGRLRLHRFVQTDAQGRLILRGDANKINDSSPVELADVRGFGVLRVPWVGLPGLWLGKGDFVPLAMTAAGAVALFLVSRLDVPYFRPRTTRSSKLPVAAGVAACVLIASGGIVSQTPAYAAFSSTTTGPASTFAALSAYPCLEPAVLDSPFFLYRFSEGSGTAAADSSGNARPGVLQGGTTRIAGSCDPNSSPALTLNGSTGYVSASYAQANPAAYSMEMWFKTATTTGGKLIGFGNAATGSSGNYDRHVYMTNAGKLIFGVYPNAVVSISSTASYNDNVWHHMVATQSAAGMRLYVDAVQVATSTTTTNQNYTGYWRIGYDNLNGWTTPPTSFFFSGTIDSVAVYTTALSAAQVSTHYSAGH